MRYLVVLLTLAIGAAASVPAALAAKPLFIRVTPTNDFVVPDSCPFPVLVHNLVTNQVVRIFGDGSSIVTGSLKDRVTNLETGKSEDVNVSGPAFRTRNPDGSTTYRYEGLTEFFPGPGALWPGSPGQFVVHAGTQILTLDQSGNVVGFSQTGRVVTDVCTDLA